MKSFHDRGPLPFAPDRAARPPGFPRPADLPIGEQFVLWALRQWQRELTAWERDGAFAVESSALREGFGIAGLLEALPDFALAMDGLLFGVGRTLEIHRPPCAAVSHDEAVLIALCSLAQAGLAGPLAASLDAMLGPQASAVVAARLTAFAGLLDGAGLPLASARGDAGRCLH